MIPLFKSHFSIGKSILKLNSNGKPGSADGIFDIAQEEDLEQVCIVEDSLTGFLESAKTAKEKGIHLIFGLRIFCCDFYQEDKAKDCHRIIVFAKDDEGCKLLNKIYSKTFSKSRASIELKDLSKLWNEKHLSLAIPFYDSFMFNNLTTFSNCAPSFNFTTPTFFIEDNQLPFDDFVSNEVNSFCKKNNFPQQKVKTIYYKNRKDFEAFQTYKCICNRGSWSGRSVSLEKPNLDHFGSTEFCIESWREFK
jgi:DNA polymerase III alpha subunit